MLFTVANPHSSSLRITQSDALLSLQTVLLLFVFREQFSSVFVWSGGRDFCLVLNLNFPTVFTGAGASGKSAISTVSFLLRAMKLKSDDCFDILLM